MATITGTFAALAATIADITRKIVPMLETPAGNLANQQGNANGHALVEVSGGTVTSVVDTSALATHAKQDTLAGLVATAAKQDTLAGLVATASKQDTGNNTLAAVLAKLVAPGTWTPATAAAGADSGVISAAATTVRSVLASNSHATTTIYLQLFDAAAVPANGTAPRIPSIPIAAGQTVLVQLGALSCANGLSWASSSTVGTKTITALTSVQCSAEIGS
jgi:hypothetical protein